MIYTFQIYSEESKDFFREIEIDGEQTFFDFHKIIQESTSYDSSQMASFYIIDYEGMRSKEISLLEMNTDDDDDLNVVVMDVTMIREFITKENPSFIYVFDFFSDRYFQINLVDIKDQKKNTKHPICIANRGEAPTQIKVDAGSFDLTGIDTATDDSSEYDFLDEFDNDINDDIKFENLDDYDL